MQDNKLNENSFIYPEDIEQEPENQRNVLTVHKSVNVNKNELTGIETKSKKTAILLGLLGFLGVQSAYLKRTHSFNRHFILSIISVIAGLFTWFLKWQKYSWYIWVPVLAIAIISLLISIGYSCVETIKISSGEISCRTRSYDIPIKIYSKKHFRFQYIVPKAFDELAKKRQDEGIELEVIGNIKPWNKFNKNKSDTFVRIFQKKYLSEEEYYLSEYAPEEVAEKEFELAENSDESFVEQEDYEKYRYYNLRPSKKRSCYGYAYVGNNQFVRIQKPIFIIWWLIGLLTLLIAGILIGAFCFRPDDYKPNIENGDIEQRQEQEIKTKYIHFPGYPSFDLFNSKQALFLNNPEKNEVYFVYTIYTTDKDQNIIDKIYSSDFIEPGKGVNAFLFNKLKVGKNNVLIHISTYNIKAFNETKGTREKKQQASGRNGANQPLVITKKITG